MPRFELCKFFSDRGEPFAIILGTNEVASAIAVRLTLEGYRVVLSHDPFPPVIRRGMAYYDALFDDHAEVGGVLGRHAETLIEIVKELASSRVVAVTRLYLTDLITLRIPDVLIDARIQRRGLTPNLRRISSLSIGLGPNFAAGVNCDVAIEPHPEQVIEAGSTRVADHMPRFLEGVGKERFVYAARDGIWRTPLDVGARIFKDAIIGRLADLPIPAPMDGVLRGVARDGVFVPKNVKFVEVDPRVRGSSWIGTDEGGRAIADATVTAVTTARAQRTPPPLRVTLP